MLGRRRDRSASTCAGCSACGCPEPEQECFVCGSAKKVTGYQRIGWLMPRGKASLPKKSLRERTEAQLARAEAEVERLKLRLEAEG